MLNNSSKIMPFELPMIPGFQNFNREIKTRYPKIPDLDLMNGTHIIRSLHVKNENRSCNSASKNYTIDLRTDYKESIKPSWLVFDKQNLTFDAYFKSTVNESFGCSYNLRKCKIIYFLEDDTIKVVEPVVINSGLPQGCLIKRHKIPLPNSGDYYQVLDLNVGISVEFYGKHFKIIGADNFTRDFLKRSGVDVPENQSMPNDPYFIDREKAPMKKQPKLEITLPKYKKIPGFEGILDFTGYWDDRHNIDGSLHNLEVRYFLADDTMQIIEHNLDGSIKTFLKRQKIPKDRVYVKPPGHSEQIDLLNVLGVNPMNRWYAFDSAGNSSDLHNSYYHWSNLYVGAEIDVYSRKITLSNCDEFTKQYYLDYDFDNFPSNDEITKVKEEEEDKSNIEDTPACQDDNILNKILNSSNMDTLVFKAKLLLKEPDNLNRKFIVKCFLNDQSFSVSELTIQTAGAIGCRFLSKQKIPKQTPNESSVVFKLYVGAEIFIGGFQFVLVDVEDRTLRFMMDHPKEFPHSDSNYIIKQVFKSIQTDIDTFNLTCFQNRNEIERNKFIEIMSNQFSNLNPHGMFVLALKYKKYEKYKEVSDYLFRSILQDELKRELFVCFDGLEINFKQRNLDKKDGYLEHNSAFKALKSAKLPFSTEIINMLLDRFSHPETNKVAYMDLLKYLNYTVDPTPGSQGFAKDILHRKSDVVFIKVGEFVNDLKKRL